MASCHSNSPTYLSYFVCFISVDDECLSTLFVFQHLAPRLRYLSIFKHSLPFNIIVGYNKTARALIDSTTLSTHGSVNTSNGKVSSSSTSNVRVVKYLLGRTNIEDHKFYEHEDLRPYFLDLHWKPLTEVAYPERGIHGHPQFRNPLAEATDIFNYNPKVGTEIRGVNLARLTDVQKDDPARLISVRGVVFFRDQTELDIDSQRELGQYFGKLLKHATTFVPRRSGLQDVHVVYSDGSSKD